jgi:hypothetical protein
VNQTARKKVVAVMKKKVVAVMKKKVVAVMKKKVVVTGGRRSRDERNRE